MKNENIETFLQNANVHSASWELKFGWSVRGTLHIGENRGMWDPELQLSKTTLVAQVDGAINADST